MRKAQSILEYIIVLSAIVGAVILASGPGGPIREAIDKMYEDAGQVMQEKSSDFVDAIR